MNDDELDGMLGDSGASRGDAMAAPPLEAVRGRGRHLVRRRRAIGSTAAAVVLAGGALATIRVVDRHDRGQHLVADAPAAPTLEETVGPKVDLHTLFDLAPDGSGGIWAVSRADVYHVGRDLTARTWPQDGVVTPDLVAVAEDGAVYVVGRHTHPGVEADPTTAVARVDRETGELTPLADVADVGGASSVVIVGDRVVVADGGGRLVAIDRDTGAVAANVQLAGDVRGPLQVEGGMLSVGTSKGLVVLDATTLAVREEVAGPDDDAVVAEGHHWGLNAAGDLLDLDHGGHVVATGRGRAYALRSEVGRLWVHTYDGIVVLDAATGRRLASLDVPSNPLFAVQGRTAWLQDLDRSRFVRVTLRG